MKPQNIFLIRHGQSHGNVDIKVYQTTPDWKVELTPKGKQQAKEAGQNISKLFTCGSSFKFYVSPWYRTRQTAEIIKQTLSKKNMIITSYEDPRLREQSCGNFQDEEVIVSKINKDRIKFGKFFYTMPCGESGAAVYDRISTFFETLYRDFEKPSFPENVVIVSHGITILAFLMRWFHWNVETFDNLKTPRNCDIIRMKLNNKTNRYELKNELKTINRI